jgi:diguanylate cyclase
VKDGRVLRKHSSIGVGVSIALFLSVVFAFCPFSLAQQGPIALATETQHKVIHEGIAYFVESEPLNHLQVSAPVLADQWQPLTGKSFNFGMLHPPTWFRFDVTNASFSEQQWLLEIGWPLLDQVEVWQYHHTHQRWSFKQKAGNDVALDARPIAHHHLLFPLLLPPGDPVTLYIRVDTQQPLFLTLDVWQPNAFWQHDQHRILLLGVFFGILLVMMLYNTSLYLFTRDMNYLYYAAYVCAVIGYELATTGIGTRYLWDNAIWLRNMGYVLFASLSFLTGTFFIRHFLSLKHYGGWLYHLNNAFVVYWAVVALSCIWGANPILTHTMDKGALVTPLAGMATGIYLWHKGNTQAKYYTIAFAFVNVGTILLMLGLTGAIERTAFTDYGQMVGFVLEAVLLSVALADRINRDRTAREEAQRVALHLSQTISKTREEKLMVQEQILDVQRRATEELENRVLDRTNELERALKNMEIANRELSKLSFSDPLTKVFNRRYFDRMLSSELKRASRTQQQLSVALVDIDHFKTVNDDHGHLIGDECLRLVAKTMRMVLGRDSDLIARYGGKAFAFILPATPQQNAVRVAERARSAVADIRFIHRGKQIRLSVSVGVAGWIPKQGEAPEKLLQAADMALFSAKKGGRNKTVAAQDPAVDIKQWGI